MKANGKNLQSIIEGQKQYVVPLFQRGYTWKKKNWETFWLDLADLLEICQGDSDKAEDNEHFMGAVVTLPFETTKKGTAKLFLIDGQQRLITIFILLAALHDEVANDNDDNDLAKRIKDNYLLNKSQKGTDILKLFPTQLQGDWDSFMKIMQGEEGLEESLITEAYMFFGKKLEGKKDIELLTLTSIITNCLMFVHVELDKDDDPYKIFESLNFKGEKLTQADLVRNYFFMKIGGSQKEQEEIYKKYWNPMQHRFPIGEKKERIDKFSEYIRHFLIRDGAEINQGDVYAVLKRKIDSVKDRTKVLDLLKELANFAIYYERLIYPEKESNKELKDRISRLNKIQVTVSYPFLLNVYHDYTTNCISEVDFIEILDALENFYHRRFICKIPTNGLNKFLPTLYRDAKELGGNLVTSVKVILAQPKFPSSYPQDHEFADAFKKKPLYGRSTETIRLILTRIELFENNKERVNLDDPTITVEHIMPQTLTKEWENSLGEDWKRIQEELGNTIGNLTLSGYNPELSNKEFLEKLKRLIESSLKLNRYFKGLTVWDAAAIQKRAEHLTEIALKIWPHLGAGLDNANNSEIKKTTRRRRTQKPKS